MTAHPLSFQHTLNQLPQLGFLHVGPLTARTPNMVVKESRFVDHWPPEWRPMGVHHFRWGELTQGMRESDEARESIDDLAYCLMRIRPHRFTVAMPLPFALRDRRIRIGVETEDHRQRLVVFQARPNLTVKAWEVRHQDQEHPFQWFLAGDILPNVRKG